MNELDKLSISFPKKEFQKVREYLASIDGIDMGGCGVSALTMYRWLEKKGYDMRNVRFVLGYNRHSESFRKNGISYTNEGKLSASCSHMGLLIEEFGVAVMLDAHGIWFLSQYEHVQVVKNTYIIGSINGSNWNEYFDRDRWIPIIEDELDIDLSDVKINIYEMEGEMKYTTKDC